MAVRKRKTASAKKVTRKTKKKATRRTKKKKVAVATAPPKTIFAIASPRSVGGVSMFEAQDQIDSGDGG